VSGADPNSDAVFNGSSPGTSPYNLETTDGFDGELSNHSGQFLLDYNLVYPLYAQFMGIVSPGPVQ
jgi:hypothetical protein